VNVAPRPASLSTDTPPPWPSTIVRTIVSPRPSPGTERLVALRER
jgi:hypothetical protein